MPLRVGIIGGSRIAIRHIQALSQLPEFFQITAITSGSKERIWEMIRVGNIGKRSDDISTCCDYRDLLQGDKLDLAIITTESGRHYSIALDCMEAGVHVFVEKPMALRVIDCENMIQQAKDSAVKLFVSHQLRFSSGISKVKQVIQNNGFGRLLHATAHIRWNRNKEYYQQADWRGTMEQDGGMLLNQCIHSIDALCWLVDSKPVEVFSFTDNLTHPEIEVEDIALGMIRFANGAYGVIEGTVNVFPKNFEETLYIFGEKGTVKLGGKSLDAIEHWEVSDMDKPKLEPYQDYAVDCYKKAYKDIADSIIKGVESIILAEQAKKTMVIIEAMYESSKKGFPIRL